MNLLFSVSTVITIVPDTNAITAIYRIDRFVWRKLMRRLTTRFAQKAPFYDFNSSVKWQLIEVNTNDHFPFRYLNPRVEGFENNNSDQNFGANFGTDQKNISIQKLISLTENLFTIYQIYVWIVNHPIFFVELHHKQVYRIIFNFSRPYWWMILRIKKQWRCRM